MKYPPKHIGIKHLDWVGIVLSTDLPSISKSLVMYLSRFMTKDKDMAWPSQARIIAELSLSKNAVNTHLNLLESEGWLLRERGSSNKNTRYIVAFPKTIEDAIKTIGSTSEVRRSTSEGLHVVPQKDTNSQLNNKTNNTPKSDDLGFSVFWDNYPRKEGRKKATQAWASLTKEKRSKATLDIKTRYTKTEKRFIPYATTYLHGERWDDPKEEQPEDQFRGAI